MATLGTLKTVIGGDASQLEAALKKAQSKLSAFHAKEAKRKTSGDGVLGGITKGLMAFPGASMVVGGVTDTFRAMFAEAADGEQKVKQLNNALQMSGAGAEKYSQQMQDMATAMSRTTKLADDDIMKLQTQALNMGIPVDKIESVIKSSLGIAEQMGKPIEDVIKSFAKLNSGGKVKLTEFGISDAGLNNQEKFNDLMEKGQGMFAATESNSSSLSTTLAQLSNVYKNVQEACGNFFVTLLESLNIGGGVGSLKDAILDAGQFIIDNAESWAVWLSKVWADIQLGFSSLFLIIGTVAINTFDWLVNTFSSTFETIYTIISNLISYIGNTISNVYDFITSDFNNIGKLFEMVCVAMVQCFQSWSDNVFNIGKAVWDYIKSGFSKPFVMPAMDTTAIELGMDAIGKMAKDSGLKLEKFDPLAGIEKIANIKPFDPMAGVEPGLKMLVDEYTQTLESIDAKAEKRAKDKISSNAELGNGAIEDVVNREEKKKRDKKFKPEKVRFTEIANRDSKEAHSSITKYYGAKGDITAKNSITIAKATMMTAAGINKLNARILGVI